MSRQSRSRHAEHDLQDITPLIDFFQTILPLPEELIRFFRERAFRKQVPKGRYLLRPGEICNHYYYIHKGILRAFVKYGTKEITLWINPEKEITTSIRSMRRQQPSEEYIQAIEPCDLIAMSYSDVAEMYERFPEANLVGRMLLEEYYSDSEERVFIGRIPNASSRYLHFVASNPELANRIPLKYIASYLSITMETLSRLRSRMARKPALND